MQELEGVGSPVRMQLFVEYNLAQSLAFMSIYCRQKATEAKLFTPQTSQCIQQETIFLYFNNHDDAEISIKELTEEGK